MPVSILEQREKFSHDYKYGGGKGCNTKNGRTIDCSNLVSQMLRGAGYDIPYEPVRNSNEFRGRNT